MPKKRPRPRPAESPGPPDPHGHIPVLLAEVLSLLAPQPGNIVVDCTAGRGGHAEALAEQIGRSGTILLFDRDRENLAYAEARLRRLPDPPTIHTRHLPFDHVPDTLASLRLKADILLADLGFASNQVDDPARGLSFRRDGPLDMRLDPTGPTEGQGAPPEPASPPAPEGAPGPRTGDGGPTAADLIADLDEDELATIFREYGEERHARRAAQFVAQERRAKPITTTARLAEVLRRAIRASPGGIDPSTRCFQALRIAVNDEIGHLNRLLLSITQGAARALAGDPLSKVTPSPTPDWLAPHCRIGVISFHSLEDRPVKQAFADLVARHLATHLPARGPLTAGDAEIAANPRSRSAKLRAVWIKPPAPKETSGWKRRAMRELSRNLRPIDLDPETPLGREGDGLGRGQELPVRDGTPHEREGSG